MGNTDAVGSKGANKNIISKIFTNSKMITLFIMFAAVVVIFAVWAAIVGESFINVNTIRSIGNMMVVTAFLACGSGFLMVSGNLDLSASAIGAFSSIMMGAALSYWGLPTPVAILLAIITGTTFGILNAVLVYEFNFAPFIGTMAMASVVRGIMMRVSVHPVTNSPVDVVFSNAATRWIANGTILGVPAMLILAIIVFIIYGLILAKSKFGMQVYLIGGNRMAANLCGISPRKMIYVLFANSAFLASIAGIVFMGRQGAGRLEAMIGNQFTGLTAAILGGVSFGGGSGNMAGVFIGILLLNTFSMGTIVVRFNMYWAVILEGVLLLFALGLDYYNVRKANKKLQ